MSLSQYKVGIPLPIEWQRLIQVAQKIDWGEARVIFQNGKPVRIEQAIKTVKLNLPADEFAIEVDKIVVL